MAPFLGVFAKWRKPTISFAMCARFPLRPSVRLHGITRLPLKGFS